MKRAILFLNLGGPETLADVRGFLMRLFEDPEVIRIPFFPLRWLVAWLISSLREKTSQSMYAKIGGGSPIRRLTDAQSCGVASLLKEAGREVEVRTAFTCSAPLVGDVVRELSAQGVLKFLALPLYPQYSFTTTKGALHQTRKALKRYAPFADLTETPEFPTHPLFLKAHAEMIREAMKEFSNPVDERIHLVFSAHSIPKNLVDKKGDPYQDQMNQTVRGVLKELNWKGPWTLSWQSKLGPVKWIGPATEEVLKDLGQRATKQVLIDPIAFVTDHIETLYELDQLIKDVALNSGILEFKRVPGLNNHPTFLKCLAEICLAQKEFWEEY